MNELPHPLIAALVYALYFFPIPWTAIAVALGSAVLGSIGVVVFLRIRRLHGSNR